MVQGTAWALSRSSNPHGRFGDWISTDASYTSAMLAADMAMRLRQTLGGSSDFPWHYESSRDSLNGFCFAHDHAGR